MGSTAAAASETASGMTARAWVGTATYSAQPAPLTRPTTRVPVGGPEPSAGWLRHGADDVPAEHGARLFFVEVAYLSAVQRRCSELDERLAGRLAGVARRQRA